MNWINWSSLLDQNGCFIRLNKSLLYILSIKTSINEWKGSSSLAPSILNTNTHTHTHTIPTNTSKHCIFFDIRHQILAKIIEQLRLIPFSFPHIFRRNTLELSLLHIANQPRFLHLHRNHTQSHPFSFLRSQFLHLHRRAALRYRHFSSSGADDSPPNIARRHQIADQNDSTAPLSLSRLLRTLKRFAASLPPLWNAGSVNYGLWIARRPLELRFVHPATCLFTGF